MLRTLQTAWSDDTAILRSTHYLLFFFSNSWIKGQSLAGLKVLAKLNWFPDAFSPFYRSSTSDRNQAFNDVLPLGGGRRSLSHSTITREQWPPEWNIRGLHISVIIQCPPKTASRGSTLVLLHVQLITSFPDGNELDYIAISISHFSLDLRWEMVGGISSIHTHI